MDVEGLASRDPPLARKQRKKKDNKKANKIDKARIM